jgi:phosphopantothenoylcysteine synthetase/decarboxylase
MSTSAGVLYVVGCAAPPVRDLARLVDLLAHDGWTVAVILTPRAASWLDAAPLTERTGLPVRSDYKLPDDPDVLPHANAVAVVPATFNTINKWSAGISDTFALGVLNETLGLGLPIVVAPYAKEPLAAHPAFRRSLAFLSTADVTLLDTNAIKPDQPESGPRWSVVRDALWQVNARR